MKMDKKTKSSLAVALENIANYIFGADASQPTPLTKEQIRVQSITTNEPIQAVNPDGTLSDLADGQYQVEDKVFEVQGGIIIKVEGEEAPIEAPASGDTQDAPAEQMAEVPASGDTSTECAVEDVPASGDTQDAPAVEEPSEEPIEEPEDESAMKIVELEEKVVMLEERISQLEEMIAGVGQVEAEMKEKLSASINELGNVIERFSKQPVQGSVTKKEFTYSNEQERKLFETAQAFSALKSKYE